MKDKAESKRVNHLIFLVPLILPMKGSSRTTRFIVPQTVTTVVLGRSKQALGHQAYLVHVSQHVESRRSSPLLGRRRDRARDKRSTRFGTWLSVGQLQGTSKCQRVEGSRSSSHWILCSLHFFFFLYYLFARLT